MSRYNTQEVCPWNGDKLLAVSAGADYLPRRSPPAGDGGAAAGRAAAHGAGPGGVDAFSRGSAIRRAGRAGFARNVCVAIGNWLVSVDEPPEAAVAVLRQALGDEEPVVREHAAWALEVRTAS